MRRLFVIQLVGVMLAILAVGMATVFNVDIKWGSVRAIYSPNRTFIWNPDNLSETEITSGSHPWRWEEKNLLIACIQMKLPLQIVPTHLLCVLLNFKVMVNFLILVLGQV